jgi:hypothetical protein
MMDAKALAAKVLHFGLEHGQTMHLDQYGGAITTEFERAYAKMCFQINVSSEHYDLVFEANKKNQKDIRDECDRFYQYIEHPENKQYARMFDSTYGKNHSFFLDQVIADRTEKYPLLKALWSQRYCDYDCTMKNADD